MVISVVTVGPPLIFLPLVSFLSAAAAGTMDSAPHPQAANGNAVAPPVPPVLTVQDLGNAIHSLATVVERLGHLIHQNVVATQQQLRGARAPSPPPRPRSRRGAAAPPPAKKKAKTSSRGGGASSSSAAAADSDGGQDEFYVYSSSESDLSDSDSAAADDDDDDDDDGRGSGGGGGPPPPAPHGGILASPTGRTKCMWTDEETAHLLAGIEAEGCSWKNILVWGRGFNPPLLQNKTGQQLSDRYRLLPTNK